MSEKTEKKFVAAYSANESHSNGGRGYWSNKHGWSFFEHADRFVFGDIKDKKLPMSTDLDAKWVKLDLPYMEDHDVDELTVAYIAMGFVKTFNTLTDEETENLTKNEGQSETVGKIVMHARFLDYVFDVSGMAFDSLAFYYEIAEPFGQEYTKALAAEENQLSRADMEAMAIKVLKDICMKALSEESYAMILQHV